MNKSNYIKAYDEYKHVCVNLVSEISNYNWSDSFSVSEIKDTYKSLIDAFSGVDFKEFTLDELKELGFKMWDDSIILMPIWALDCLKRGDVVLSISGKEIIIGDVTTLSKDVRFGCTAYGFSISQLRDAKIISILE
jgi:predicted RNA-binding protein with EMAP domain